MVAMLYLNKKHPDFSMHKEVLCLIPQLPALVEMTSICHDLGIDRTRLNQIVKELRYSYRITQWPMISDIGLGSPQMSWRALNKDAVQYYERVYHAGRI